MTCNCGNCDDMEANFGIWLNKETYPESKMPERAHQTDAGWDLFAVLKDGMEKLYIAPGERHLISTGVHLKLQPGWEAQIRPRSGNALIKGLTVLNAPGTVDSSYCGEIMVILYNASDEATCIYEGDKVAQIVFKRVPTITLYELDEKPTNETRGDAGFGSTGN